MRLILIFTFLPSWLLAQVGPHHADVTVLDYDRRVFELSYQVPVSAEYTEFAIYRGATLEDVTVTTLCFAGSTHQFRLADMGGRFRFRITSWDRFNIPRFETDWNDGLLEVEFAPEALQPEPYPAVTAEINGNEVVLTLLNAGDFEGDPPRPSLPGAAWEWVDGVARMRLPAGTHEIAIGPARVTVTVASVTSYVGWYSSAEQGDLVFNTTFSVASSWEPREVLARLFTANGVREAYLRVDDSLRVRAHEWVDLFPGASGVLVLEPLDGAGAIQATATITNSMSPNVAAIRSRLLDESVTVLATTEAGALFVAAANPSLDLVDVSVVVDGTVIHTEQVPPRGLWRSLDVLSDLDGSHHIEIRGAPAWVGAVNGHEVVTL